MIKLTIETDGKDMNTEFEHKNTTLKENAMIIRELEVIKQELLNNFSYKPKLEIFDDGWGNEYEESG